MQVHVDNVATAWRHALCAGLTALGTVSERIACGEHEHAAGCNAAAAVVRCLLPYTIMQGDASSEALEPEELNPHRAEDVHEHRSGSMGTRAWSMVAPEQTEFWTRMNSAHALLRLCSGGSLHDPQGKGSVVTPTTVSHHGDDRFPLALCLLAHARASSSSGAHAISASALAEMDAAGAADAWEKCTAELAARASEPWLVRSGVPGVDWL